MTVYVYSFLGLCSVATYLHARDVLVEAKVAYFLPTDHKCREIYSGGGMYGGECTFQVRQKLYGWISADYFSKEGSSIGGHDPTNIIMVPLGAGLKLLFPFKTADLYIGAGVLGTYVHMRDHSPFVIQSISKWGVGGIAKVGVICNLPKHFFADLFTNYTYTKIDFHGTDHEGGARQDANISGCSFGAGIGYRFGCPN